MSQKRRAEEFCDERRRELVEFGRVLAAYQIDSEPIKKAAAACSSPTGKRMHPSGTEEYTFAYDMDRMRIGMLPRNVGAYPTAATSIDVVLKVSLGGYCLANAQHDPLYQLSTEVFAEANIGGQRHQCAWHLDRHLTGGAEPAEVHPIYHFQYGGDEITGNALFNYGGALLLDPPRIAHPPLDVILGVDFVLSNYFGQLWKSMRIDSDYSKWIESAQKRLWRPYALAARNHFAWPGLAPNTLMSWATPDVWPQVQQAAS
jgi:hypothetical protein